MFLLATGQAPVVHSSKDNYEVVASRVLIDIVASQEILLNETVGRC